MPYGPLQATWLLNVHQNLGGLPKTPSLLSTVEGNSSSPMRLIVTVISCNCFATHLVLHGCCTALLCGRSVSLAWELQDRQ
jgi:hypothetical protein